MSDVETPFDVPVRVDAGWDYRPLAVVECAAAGAYARPVRDLMRVAAGEAGAGEETADQVRLLTGELFANCVRHAPGTTVRVRVLHDPPAKSLAVAVEDTDRTGIVVPDPGVVPPGWAEHGYGLPLMRAMAADCGVTPLVDGKRVWFRLNIG